MNIRLDPYLVSCCAEVTGKDLSLWLARRLATTIRRTKDLCIDNIRVAEVGNPTQEAKYAEQQANGCCGFCDKEITHFKTGRTFRYGFNYGH